jgi:hypothetical protein
MSNHDRKFLFTIACMIITCLKTDGWASLVAIVALGGLAILQIKR